MRAQRYRLRFVTGAATTPATYGSSTYGGPITYGQQATDPVASFRYRVVPLPAGYLSDPAWIRRVLDLKPLLRAQITSDQGTLNLAGVHTVRFVFDAADGRTLKWIVTGFVEDAVNGIVTLSWDSAYYGDSTYGGPITYGQKSDDPPLIDVGVYRVVVVLDFTSGRRFSLPGDDNTRLHVLPAEEPAHA